MVDSTSPHPPVVVGVDGSAGSDRALRWAAQEAIARDAPLVVAHAWMVPAVVLAAPVGAFAADPAPFAEAATQIVDEALALVAEDFPELADRVTTLVTEGYAIEHLVDASVGAALLVVGSRGRGGFASLVLGSVADGCAHRAHCPVMVVRPDAAPPGEGDIVVGVDGSPHGIAALRWAAAEAGRLRRRLTVVIAHDVHQLPPAALSEAPGELPLGIERDFAIAARRFVDRMIGPLALDGHKPRSVSWRVVQQAAPSALLEAASDASMLVVGSRDRLSLRDRLLGSVSRQCLHHAPCPVVVVHDDGLDTGAVDADLRGASATVADIPQAS